MIDGTEDGASDQTTREGGAGVAGTAAGDDKGWREQNTRLRQELAEQKELNRQAVPYVQVALALQKTDGTTYQKLARGEELTPKQVAKTEAAAAEAGLTVEEFEKRMAKFGQDLLQRQAADMHAAKEMDKLDTWATEKLPGYDKMKGTRMWNGMLDSVLRSIENGTWEVPEGVTDPYKFAVEQAYNMVKQQSPELAKGGKVVAKTEEERLAAILTAGRKPSSSKQETNELAGLPDDIRKEIEFTRSIGGSVGKKFSP